MIAKRGFTLIELLVVIAIIALLLAILTPSLHKVKRLARSVVCRTNLSQIGKATEMYVMAHNYKRFEMRANPSETDGYWWGKLAPYFGDDDFDTQLEEGRSIDVLMCTSAPASKFNESVQQLAGGTTGVWGEADKPWRWNRTDGISTIGSYTMNAWVGHDAAYDNVAGRKEYMYRNWLDASYDVPLFGCGTWTASWPMGTDPVPTDLRGGKSVGMGQWCIDRHSKKINIIYKDLSAEPVELEELWRKPWHKNYKYPTGEIVLPDS